MERLAQETWLHIFQFLSPSNTLRVSLTCKDWHVLWQDVTLWKPFHDAKFGGCPIPPLQPNDWMGSFKNVSAQLKIDSLSAQLRIGISTGRTVFVDRLLQEHPELFYPPLCVCGRPQFMDPHPLEVLGPTHNPDMFKLVWTHFVSHTFTKRQLQLHRAERPLPSKNQNIREYTHSLTCEKQHRKRRVYEVSEQAVEACALKIFNAGDEPMLQQLFSFSPEAEEFILQNFRYLSLSGVSVEMMDLLEEKGVSFDLQDIRRAFSTVESLPVAKWLMERVDGWQGRDEVLCAFFREVPKLTREARGILKTLLLEADKWATTELNWYYHLMACIGKPGVDRKAIKWFWRRHAKGKEPVRAKDIQFAFSSHAITTQEDPDFLYFLLDLGAIDVNAADFCSGQTLLHLAVEKNHLELIKELLKCGADPTIKNRGGFAPLHLANRGVRALLEAELKSREAAEAQEVENSTDEERDYEPQKKKSRTTEVETGRVENMDWRAPLAPATPLWDDEEGQYIPPNGWADQKKAAELWSLMSPAMIYALLPQP